MHRPCGNKFGSEGQHHQDRHIRDAFEQRAEDSRVEASTQCRSSTTTTRGGPGRRHGARRSASPACGACAGRARGRQDRSRAPAATPTRAAASARSYRPPARRPRARAAGRRTFARRAAAGAPVAALDQIGHWMQCAVLIEGRAVEFRQFDSGDRALAKRREQTRLADAALARNQHRLALSVARQRPAFFRCASSLSRPISGAWCAWGSRRPRSRRRTRRRRRTAQSPSPFPLAIDFPSSAFESAASAGAAWQR